MSYGIEILNLNDRILIDDQYPFPGYQSTTASTVTPGGAFPPAYTGNANQQSGDLVIARAASGSNGVVGKGRGTNWPNTGGYYSLPSSYSYYLIRNLSSLISASTSGYGLEVYGSNGTDVYFTSNISKGLIIVESGSLNSASSGVYSIPWPSATGTVSDLHKHYCIINETNIWSDPVIFQTYRRDYITGYRYEWTATNTGRIHIESYYLLNTNLPNNKSGINRTFNYVILKELS